MNDSNEPLELRFDPEDYRSLDEADRELLAEAYHHAVVAIRKNITPLGFSACSLEDNPDYGTDENYKSVWARDGALTVIWTLQLADDTIRQAQRDTLKTLFRHQSPTGQIPSNVRIETDVPDYSGVGGIASIDSVMWVIIAATRFAEVTGEWWMVEEHLHHMQQAMNWLSAHDANNCGLLEVPEASDWADLFGFSYHVLYDEVLWYRANVCFARVMRHLGDTKRADDYANHARHIRKVFLKEFWPSTKPSQDEDGFLSGPVFTDTQYRLGDARYLVAQVSPFSFSWRCDVYGNLLAFLTGLLNHDRAMMTFRFLWGVGANDPWPVKNLYPPVQAGDPEWRDYYTVNLLNLPNHYHNGGIWPFIGGVWVRAIHKLGLTDIAQRELVHLAKVNQSGAYHEFEFNEWYHGQTGRAMGKYFQAWSAASFIQACHDLPLPSEVIEES